MTPHRSNDSASTPRTKGKWGVYLLLPLSLAVIYLQGRTDPPQDFLADTAQAQESDHGHAHDQPAPAKTAANEEGVVPVGLRTQAALGIVTRPVVKEDLAITLDLNGTVRPRPQDIHDIHTAVEGIVLELHAFPGDSVEVGDPLLTLQVQKILDWQEVLLHAHAETKNLALAIPFLQAEGEAKMIEFLGGLQAKSAETQHYQEELDILRSAGSGAVSRQEIHHKEGELKASRAELQAKRALALAYGLEQERIDHFETTLGLPENPEGLIAPEYQTLLQEKRFSLETRKVQAETAKANLRSVGFPEEKIANLENGLSDELSDRLDFRSTSSGLVVASEISLQQAVTPADHLFRVVDYRTVYIDAEVPEQDIARAVSRTDAAMPVRALGLNGEILRATAVYLDTSVSRERRMARLVASMENLPGLPLRDGMAVTLGMVTGSAQEVLTVPTGAVLRQGLENIVFVRDPKYAEDFNRRLVRVGLSNLERTEIVSGLQAGEEVVVEGAFHLLLALQQSRGEGKEVDHGHAHH